MYLRRNKVRCGDSHRTYLSIAHNVWWSHHPGRPAQSRPVVVASFGVEDNVDIDIARDLVQAVEKCAPRLSVPRGEGRAATVRLARELRKIEPFLKRLASHKLGLAQLLPSHPERAEILETLVRDQLNETSEHGVADLVSNIRAQVAQAQP